MVKVSQASQGASVKLMLSLSLDKQEINLHQRG